MNKNQGVSAVRPFGTFSIFTIALVFTIPLLWYAYFTTAPARPDEFVQAEGRHLVQNGEKIRLQAVSFSNYYSYSFGQGGFALDTSKHHTEEDFKRVHDLGFNTVRFAFNGNWYNQNPKSFWTWLDKNVAWAKKHDVMLVLDLHVPIGGFWLDPTAENLDFSLWTDKDLLEQNVELWRAIAERYKDEPVIAAYELLNEAVTDDTSGDQWKSLASETVKAIRSVDTNHLLVVGALYGTDRRYKEMGRNSQFFVDDPNVMYDFHFYQPIEYTHQNASWVATPMGDGGTYPDYETPIPTNNQVFSSSSSISSQRLRGGDTAWLKYESDWAELTDPSAVAGLPVLVLRAGARGRADFDDIEVFEYDIEKQQQRKIVSAPLSKNDIWHWWGWSNKNKEDLSNVFRRSVESGANDSYSLRIDGATTSNEYLGWSSDSLWFKSVPGNLYKITGYIRGAGVEYSDAEDAEKGFIGAELNFYAHPEDPNVKGFVFRDKEYLESEFLKMYQFGVDNNVPMSVLEFGVIRDTFETDGKGGAIWISDMLDIFNKYQVSFSLWNYHGSSMGIFQSDFGSEPSKPNLKLIEVIEKKLVSPVN